MKQIRKLFSLLLVCAILAVGTVVPAAAVETDRTGWTAISTPEELAAIKNDLSGSYYLTADIDMSGVSWTPIGFYAYAPFKGQFDGNGHTISNLTVSNSTAGQNAAFVGVGLFGVCSGATIENLYMLDANVTNTATSYAAAGIITGICYNTTISNCVTTGSVSHKATYGVGGIAGYAWLNSSYSSTSGEIFRCASSATVTSNSSYAGGIIGNTCRPVSECYFTGSVTSGSGCAGGIAGQAKSTVSDCWTYGHIEGKQNGNTGGVGGIVGYASSTVTNCYTVADVNVKNTFNTTNATYRSGQPAVGGGGTVTATYFEKGHFSVEGAANTSWDTYSGSYLYGKAKTQEEMTTASTFSGWDASIWTLEDGAYPQLIGAPSLTPVPPQPTTEKVTVSFDSGSHTNADFAAVDDITVTVNVGESGTVTLPDAPENTGEWVYTFLGWSDGETLYGAGDEFAVSADTELTAVWQLYSVDGDNQWTYLDAMTIMDSLAGTITFAPEQTEISDRDGDGEITYLDAMTIMDVLAGSAK